MMAVAVYTALGATATAIIGYLQSERAIRPVAVAALRSGVPENVNAIWRHTATGCWRGFRPPAYHSWRSCWPQRREDCLLHATPEALFNPILMMALAALGIDPVSTLLVLGHVDRRPVTPAAPAPSEAR